jgi:hypothetical protein
MFRIYRKEDRVTSEAEILLFLNRMRGNGSPHLLVNLA